jgi:hypothetical protein
MDISYPEDLTIEILENHWHETVRDRFDDVGFTVGALKYINQYRLEEGDWLKVSLKPKPMKLTFSYIYARIMIFIVSIKIIRFPCKNYEYSESIKSY